MQLSPGIRVRPPGSAEPMTHLLRISRMRMKLLCIIIAAALVAPLRAQTSPASTPDNAPPQTTPATAAPPSPSLTIDLPPAPKHVAQPPAPTTLTNEQIK